MRVKPTLYVASLKSTRTDRIELPNAVDRIEVMGRDAIVVGAAAGGLGFTAIELSGWAPRAGDHYLHPMTSEGESRSHAFFYRPDPGAPFGDSGVLGLPVAKAADLALERFFGSAASIAFLRRQDRRLAPAGELAARPEGVADDGCRASCVDWYGNARPIFLGRRTFALLGYELVEGSLGRSGIREVARLDFAPPRRRAAG